MGFKLVDEGTLETVVECEDCGERLRYTIEDIYPDPGDLTEEEMDANRIPTAMELAREEHECGAGTDEATAVGSHANRYIIINPDGRPIVDPAIVGIDPLFDDLTEAESIAAKYLGKVYMLESIGW